MKGVVFQSNGGPEVLEFQEVAEPSPSDGKVLVDIEAVGVNFRDVYEREGGGYGSPAPAGTGIEGPAPVHGKAKLAREAGADEVIGYQDFAKRTRELTRGEGVAAVYDGVGKTTFYESLPALRPFGRMILYGAASGQPDPLKVQMLA